MIYVWASFRADITRVVEVANISYLYAPRFLTEFPYFLTIKTNSSDKKAKLAETLTWFHYSYKNQITSEKFKGVQNYPYKTYASIGYVDNDPKYLELSFTAHFTYQV